MPETSLKTLSLVTLFIPLTVIAHVLCMPALAQPVGTPQSQPSDYSVGLSAYMNGDYETAQLHWSNAVQLNDGRAMFNLGLLHERQKIAGASQEQAEHWFQRAGGAGYAPADYHLALRLQARGEHEQAQGLLQRAASAGFVLAQERLGGSRIAGGQTSTVVPSPNQIRPKYVSPNPESRTAADTDTSTLTRAETLAQQVRRYNRENWVLEQNPDAWTIQLLAFSDEAKVRNFIDDHGLHRSAAYFAEVRGEAVIYKLIYGAYPSKPEADQTRAGFTSALKEHGPWLRPIRSVQAVIQKQANAGE